MDSSESPTHGEQEGSAWNGHFGCTCYHPLFVFNQYGDLERCLLRPGNVHSAEDWRLVLEPVIAHYRERGIDLCFRADAAFAKPEVYELMESEDIRYAIRLPANQVLQRRIGHLLTRPVGRLREMPDPGLERADPFEQPVEDGKIRYGITSFAVRLEDQELLNEINKHLLAFRGTPEYLAMLEKHGLTEADLPPEDMTTAKICAG
jgi:hypothetical protein